MYTLENDKIKVEINAQGALVKLGFTQDAYDANFVLATADEPWVPPEKQWGLGFFTVGGQRIQIGNCMQVRQTGDALEARYQESFSEARFGCVWDGNREESRMGRAVEFVVVRELRGDGLWEKLTLVNRSEQYLVLDEIGLYSSFHDTYAMGKHALSTHMNQHIWMGGDLSYIEAQRQSGIGPHMGLITLAGRFSSYQVEELNSSNHRGVIAMMAKDIRIPAGGSWQTVRLVTDFENREDFEEKICQYTGYPVLDYGRLTLVVGEAFCFHVKKRGSLRSIRIEDAVLEEKNGCFSYRPEAVGEFRGRVYFGDGKIARMRLRVLAEVLPLLRKRADFLWAHQQLNDPTDLRDGAFMPYHNLEERIYKTEDFEGLYYAIPDRNEARERLGMGAFLAAMTRRTGDPAAISALQRYSAYVERYLIDKNYDVWDSYEHQAAARFYSGAMKPLTDEALDMRFRSFNYVFVLAFLAEMYWLTKQKHYAELCAGILERYAEKYALGGNTCMFGVDMGTVHVLEDAGMTGRAASLRQYLRARAAYLLKIDDHYDPSEVIYEQGTTASAMREIADCYLETKDATLLESLEKQRIRTLAFEGNQPDYRCFRAATIHWDDFWFGSLELWGDTMPHYWDTISADAYCMYAKITGNAAYWQRAESIFRNCMALINADGSCWNCYIYPEKVNGRAGARPEPLANDQDWAFYTYLKSIERLEKQEI